jgi:hypothetical protein
MLSCFAVDGGQPEPRSIIGANDTLAFAIITGDLTYWVSSARWSVSIDFPSQGIRASTTVVASVTGRFKQPALSRAQRDQFPVRVNVE